ncbi:general substrate transporter [Epithele typhae]|uniref:general substrate transporter n=1 Tax=Epithele typhae TaxID=378194 RepID=UPI0020086B96|nr:general substrate transporter [Epithele typhae]KAH9939329.1 general substrate transporter [Epithele typhae]
MTTRQDSFDDADMKGSVRSPTFEGRVEETVFKPELKEAIDNSKLDPWSRRAVALYFICMVGFMNAVSSGFDGSLMGGINAMDQYLNYFHYTSTGSATGIIFLIYVVGQFAGAFFAGPAADRFGRRGGMAVGCTIILIGASVVTAAQNPGMFLGGRFVLGFGIAISTTAAPMWVTELAPAHWRGRLGAAYNSCYFVGAIPATGIMVGSVNFNSTWAWRLPLLLQVIPPTIVLSCLWFCPESPRWLVSRGHIEEARAVMMAYHSVDGKSTNPLIEFQLREFQEMIQVRKMEPVWDYSALWRSANARWRVVSLALMCWNGQLAGNGLITYFLPVILKNAGVTSSHTQLLYNFANNLLSCAGAFTGAALTDRMPRRARLYIGSILLAALLATVAALSGAYGKAGNTNVDGAHATIAMIFLFGITYSFVYTPLQALYCAEVLDQEMRAKGMAVHVIIANSAGFINTFANSVGLQRWGYKYYFVFVVWDVIAGVLWFLFGAETRGRTLEELDEVFNQPWPAFAGARKVKVVVKESGDREVVEVIDDAKV